MQAGTPTPKLQRMDRPPPVASSSTPHQDPRLGQGLSRLLAPLPSHTPGLPPARAAAHSCQTPTDQKRRKTKHPGRFGGNEGIICRRWTATSWPAIRIISKRQGPRPCSPTDVEPLTWLSSKHIPPDILWLAARFRLQPKRSAMAIWALGPIDLWALWPWLYGPIGLSYP
jgi:hypothetical protein